MGLTIEKISLRYAIISSLFLALAGIEGFLMRLELAHVPIIEWMESLGGSVPSVESVYEHFYSIMTVHPVVGIYGWAYMAVMAAFLYLVPKLLNKTLFSLRLANINMWVHVSGVIIAWLGGFIFEYGSLYTLYWPLPVMRFPPAGTSVFAIGLFLIEISVLMFIFNIFATVIKRRGGSLNPGKALRWLFMEAFGLSGLLKRLRGFGVEKMANGGGSEPLPVFVVAVMRGSVDAVLNALVLAGAGVLILIYALPALVAGVRLDPFMVDPLVYKNIYWWGLDMIADGDVLIWTAGTLYLLAPLLTGRKLYAEEVVRYVILADLIISMGVWSHHLLSDRPQPAFMRLISGQFITWGEFFTMGLTFFAVLMTVWLARPVKLTIPMKFMLATIFGFMLGGFSGLLQANYALNIIMHNTQWVPGFHIHQMLLTGLGSLIFAVIYALLPMLTGTGLKSERLSNLHFWLWTVGGIGHAWSMGLAWRQGMLRRTLYLDTLMYQPYMVAAIFFAALIAIGFLLFLVNLIQTYGLRTLVGLFIPSVAKAEGG